MKNTKKLLSLLVVLTTTSLVAQHSGNVNSNDLQITSSGNYNYQNQYQNNQVNTIQTTTGNENEMYISIKGIYNEKTNIKLPLIVTSCCSFYESSEHEF